MKFSESEKPPTDVFKGRGVVEMKSSFKWICQTSDWEMDLSSPNFFFYKRPRQSECTLSKHGELFPLASSLRCLSSMVMHEWLRHSGRKSPEWVCTDNRKKCVVFLQDNSVYFLHTDSVKLHWWENTVTGRGASPLLAPWASWGARSRCSQRNLL